MSDFAKDTNVPINDYISRQASLAAMDTWDKFGCDSEGRLVRYEEHYVPYVHYEDMVNVIKNMPSADVQPVRHGHWMFRKADSGYHTDCVCSECKRKHAIGWDYCPNCGARMDGEQDG